MQNETKSCLECATRGLCVEIRGEVCGTCGTVAPAAITPRTWGETQEQFRARAFAEMEAMEAALIEAAPIAEEVTEAPAKAVKAPKKTRCPHYSIIKEFAAIARENGLSMKDADRARGAMGVYLGVKISSRADLSAAQWQNAITGLRAGVLFW